MSQLGSCANWASEMRQRTPRSGLGRFTEDFDTLTAGHAGLVTALQARAEPAWKVDGDWHVADGLQCLHAGLLLEVERLGCLLGRDGRGHRPRTSYCRGRFANIA
jgi:hypothetical protein